MAKRLYSDKREKFRNLIKQVRLDARLTQADVAAILRRNQSYVSDYERGPRRLDWVAVEEVAAACGCDVVKFARLYAAATREP